MSNKYGQFCPICKTEWTKTPRIVCNDYWYSCEKCGKKADDILKEHKEKQKSTNTQITEHNGYNLWGRGGL